MHTILFPGGKLVLNVAERPQIWMSFVTLKIVAVVECWRQIPIYTYETGEDDIHASCHYKKQYTETRTGSLWILCSDSQLSEKTEGYVHLTGLEFRRKSRERVWNSGKQFNQSFSPKIFLTSFLLLTGNSVPLSWVVDDSPWSTMAQISPWLCAVILEHRGWIACRCPVVRIGLVIHFRSWNNSFLHALVTKCTNYNLELKQN